MPLASLRWQLHVYGHARKGVAQACCELGLPLHIFDWRPDMPEVGLARDALYLVRPDGCVTLADPDVRPERLPIIGSGMPARARRLV